MPGNTQIKIPRYNFLITENVFINCHWLKKIEGVKDHKQMADYYSMYLFFFQTF